jgi:hypothetical protein
MLGRIARTLRPALRRLAAAGAAAALAAGSLLSPPPAAADTTYSVNVTYDNVKFTMVHDGCAGLLCQTDGLLEVYGTVAAYTSAGGASAGGLPYRNFGTWGQSPSGCPAWVPWDASHGTTCPKRILLGTHDFTKVLLCAGGTKDTCGTGYSKNNNTIPLQVRPGEQIIVSLAMQDYDSWSANDTVCVGNLKFGPYSERELLAKKYVADSQGKSVSMPFNGDAECWAAFHLS